MRRWLKDRTNAGSVDSLVVDARYGWGCSEPPYEYTRSDELRQLLDMIASNIAGCGSPIMTLYLIMPFGEAP